MSIHRPYYIYFKLQIRFEVVKNNTNMNTAFQTAVAVNVDVIRTD